MTKQKHDFEKIAEQLKKDVGGLDNISDIYHCATRLRIVVKDPTQVNQADLKNIDGFLGVMVKGNEVQNVVGQTVDEYYNGVMQHIGFNKAVGSRENSDQLEDDDKGIAHKYTFKSAMSAALDFISGVILPVMPVFVAAGFLMALLNLSKTFFGLDPNGGTATVLGAIASAGFYFLPAYIGFHAAIRMKIPGAMGAFLGAILVSEPINSVSKLSFLGFHVAKVQYNGTVLPVILGVLILAFFYRNLNKILPKEVTYFFTPLISIVLTLPLVILLIGPMSNVISNGLADGFRWLSSKANWLAFALYSGLNPILVMFGIDKGFIPIVINNMSTFGYDTIIYPGAMTSNPAMGAAAIAVAFWSHRAKTKGEGFSAGVTGILGITEPSIFGFLLPYRRALIGAIAGGAIGGLVGGIFQVKQGALMSPGAISLVSYFVGDNPTANFIFAVIALLTSIVASFTITSILIRTDKNANKNVLFSTDVISDPASVTPDTIASAPQKTVLTAPVDGTLEPITKVDDELFASKAMGDGYAVIPNDDNIYSPVTGTITSVFPSKHAIGFKTDNGLEVLLHMGIDTVSLNGEPFDITITANQHITAGDRIGTMNRTSVKKSGKDDTVLVIVTNSQDIADFPSVTNKKVTHGELVETITH